MKKHLDVYSLGFAISIFAICEAIKIFYGMPQKIAIFNLFFYSIIIGSIDTKLIRYLITFFIYLVEFFEVGTYNLYSMPINAQAINSIDLKWIMEDIPIMFPLMCLALVLVVLLLFAPFKSHYISIEIRCKPIVTFLVAVSLYHHILRYYRDIIGNEYNTLINQNTGHINIAFLKFVTTKPRVIKTVDKPKNLILLQTESLEQSVIDEIATPFMYNLSKQYAYVDNINSLPYTTWSTAGTLITQCNIPQIITDMRFRYRFYDLLSKYNILPCIPDYLAKIGYKLMKSPVGSDSLMGMSAWTDFHNYTLYYKAKTDIDLFTNLSNSFLPKYNVLGEDQRFLLFATTLETHGPYYPSKNCTPTNPTQSNMKKCHNCFDQALKIFVTKFLELNMQRHTLLVIYSDHIQPGNYLPAPRKLFIMFPGVPIKPARNESTYHDFAPTVLEEMGILEYEPKFPFGSNVFTSNEFSYANSKDLILIYNILVKKFNFKKAKRFVCHTHTTLNQTEICNQTNA